MIKQKNKKNNNKQKENKLWFKRKSFGWGWTPSSWEGWLVIFSFTIFLLADFFRINTGSNSASDILNNFFFDTVIATILLILICFKKGEKPKWQWGRRK